MEIRGEGAAPTDYRLRWAAASGAIVEAKKPNVAVSSPFPPRWGGKGAGGIGGEKKQAYAVANQRKCRAS